MSLPGTHTLAQMHTHTEHQLTQEMTHLLMQYTDLQFFHDDNDEDGVLV